jgi:excisionase family DNA binding protein
MSSKSREPAGDVEEPVTSLRTLSIREAARRLGMTPEGVRQAIATGRLAAVATTVTRWRVPVSVLAAFRPSPASQRAGQAGGGGDTTGRQTEGGASHGLVYFLISKDAAAGLLRV